MGLPQVPFPMYTRSAVHHNTHCFAGSHLKDGTCTQLAPTELGLPSALTARGLMPTTPTGIVQPFASFDALKTNV
jgi:hypothetical protein